MLDLSADVAELTAALVDIASVSGDETHLADEAEQALRALAGIAVEREGNVLIARTDRGLPQRVVLAGHLDTVPIANNVPSRREGDVLHGCGTCDMKAGLAVMLRVAYLVGTGAIEPRVDLTWIAYDCEEVEAERNGLTRLARTRPDVLRGDLAILLEPTDGTVEGGCQGTLRVRVHIPGVRAHSARSWLGANAIHAAGPLLDRLAAYEARVVDVDGLTYHEGLNAVGITGGVAGNVIPDECVVTVNFRFAPDRSEQAALDHVRDVLAGYDLELTDSAPGARPGLDSPLAAAFVAAVGGPARAKYGYTDVARFGTVGVPALNFAPGDPNLAHKPEEHVSMSQIRAAEDALIRFLT
ncbi:succinyl-diaminopimelate desuccinylase [uncultured Jatrophihabitans sp.]|uniref:succinyl-diaminopimelate desuccinylase n=1 Tax=uncultured Jatrophihabitans sp. TaxID=1610747 RepID=UPI0035CA9D92